MNVFTKTVTSRFCRDEAGSFPDQFGVLSEADVFLRTNLYDGDSISVREALSIGVPSVVSDHGMRPPGVQLFLIGDQMAMVGLVLKTLGDPGPRPATAGTASGQGLDEVYTIYTELA